MVAFQGMQSSSLEDNTILWTLWKEQNDRIFKETSSSWGEIAAVRLGVEKQALVRNEFIYFKLDDVLSNWKVCMLSAGERKGR